MGNRRNYAGTLILAMLLSFTMGMMVPAQAVTAAPFVKEPGKVSGSKNAGKAKSVKVKSISLNYSEYTLKKGKTLKLKAALTPKKAGKQDITWKSSKKFVATVTAKGVVKAKKKGKATITATVKGSKAKASCRICVGTPVKKISVGNKAVSLTEGETAVIAVSVEPKSASNKKVTYASSRPGIVSVGSNGRITAKKPGNASISVKAKDGSGKKATVAVTVKEKEATVNPKDPQNPQDPQDPKDPQDPQDPQNPDVPVTGVNVTPAEKELETGGTFSLNAKVMPENATNRGITFESSDPSVATVDARGRVAAVKAGKADITATAEADSQKKGVCKVTVVAPIVPVNSIALSASEKAIAVEESFDLQASLEPENATNQQLAWSSSNPQVAAVENGTVTGVKAGTATITVQADSGSKTASCTVTVNDEIRKVDFEGLKQALEGKKASRVFCNTPESGTFEIPEADYSGITLNINAPQATVTNYASFKKIEISDISRDTWIEKATGNQIDLTAKEAHLIVDGEDVSITAGSKAGKVKIEVNGTIGKLTIEGKTDVSIEGTNRTTVPMTIKGEGASVTASIPVAVDAQQKMTLNILAGAEMSSVSIPDETAMPIIQGMGMIPVTNRQTGEITDVIAENMVLGTEDENTAPKGSVAGLVQDVQNKGIAGAVVYMIPYQNSIDKNHMDAAIDAAENQERCYVVQTGADGKYRTPALPYGNYVLIVKSDGMRTYFQTMIIGREKIDNEAITMTEYTEAVGSVQGTLHDAFDASTVPAGITLYLREGANSVTGPALATTVTDASGGYAFNDLVPGTYTVQVEDKRAGIDSPYVRMSFHVVALANTTVQENMTITKEVAGSQVRFVLTWGKESKEIPGDLDSHLIGPSTISGMRFHTDFEYPFYRDNGVQYADLDVDDTSWEGPETTTVYNPTDGLYHFYIHNFTDRDKTGNTRLANSRAVVNVYRGSRNIATFYVPDGIGTVWDVCTYDIKNNTLTSVSEITEYAGKPYDIGLEPSEVSKLELAQVMWMYGCCDYGQELAEETRQMIADARAVLEQETNPEILTAKIEELADYFLPLENSTAIKDVSAGEELNTSYIDRQGYVYYPDPNVEKVGLLDGGYSLITLYGYSETMPEELQITLEDKDASFELMDSDKEEYDKLCIVTNAVTKAVEKYYLQYLEYIPDLVPLKVTETGNYIVSNACSTQKDEDGKVVSYYTIYGENETLGNPKFQFQDKYVSYTYEPSLEEGIEGVLTVSYKDLRQVYLVKYEKKIRPITLRSVKEEGNQYQNATNLKANQIEIDGKNYYSYVLAGSQEKLGVNGMDKVLLTFNVTPESYEITEDSGEGRTHKVTVTYKGMTAVLYLDYTQSGT